MAGSPESALTPRERAVLDLVRQRWSNAEIAAELMVSVRTVESHVSSLLRKVGVPDRRALGRDPGHPGSSPGAPDTVIRFVEVAGGRSLAFAETGSGATLVKTATWLTQVDKDTVASPIWGHWVRELGKRHRYVRYDPRGCGLSDRDLNGADLTDLDLWIEDLRAVVGSLGQGPVALLGISQGGPVAFGFAARYPELVSHLVLYGTYACGMRRRGDPVQADEATVQVDLAKVAWRSDNERFRETFARQFVPDADADEVGWFTDQLSTTTTPENAPLLESAFHDLDATDLARRVKVPTLVLHATGDRGVPFEQGRRLAGLIPGARFVALNSRNHILLQRDIAFAQFLDEVERFLRT
jgi:pimeloyl-ACP methyl ester carboxylesterase/DNA-binding CsgD family transcriptional regulator